MRLMGKNILVVGAGPGLGSATAYFLLKEHATVLVSARHKDRLAELANGLAQYGRVLQVPGDASSMEGAAKIIKSALGQLEKRKLDGIALLVGSYVDTPIDSFKDEDLASMVDLNLKAPLYMMKASLPYLNKGSSVVMVSSVLGTTATGIKNVAYSSTKAGVAKAVEVLSGELLDKGVRVNAVAPRNMKKEFVPEREWKKERQLGDMVCPPEDVARVVVWLMTDEADWVNGVVVPVDGGYNRRK